MSNEFEQFGFNDLFGGFNNPNKPKQPSVKDIADRYKEIFVKCPCCEHTIKIKLKV